MAIVMTFDYAGESVDTADRAYFMAQYGDDGPANGGDPELLLGGPSGAMSDRLCWDACPIDGSAPDDGSWNGWGIFGLSAAAGGGLTLGAPDATTPEMTYSDDTYGRITDVSFDAESNLAGATIRFEDVDARFYSGDTLVDEYQADISATATGASDGTTAQEIVDVSPSTFADSVKITAQVEMFVPAGSSPGPTDLQAKIGIGSTSGGPA